MSATQNIDRCSDCLEKYDDCACETCYICGDLFNKTEEKQRGNNKGLCAYHFDLEFSECKPCSDSDCDGESDLESSESESCTSDADTVPYSSEEEFRRITGIETMHQFISLCQPDVPLKEPADGRTCIPFSSLMSAIRSFYEQRFEKYIEADERAFGQHQLETWEYSDYYYGQLTACVRCGEINHQQRSQMLMHGTCFKCATVGLRADPADEYYFFDKHVYKIVAWPRMLTIPAVLHGELIFPLQVSLFGLDAERFEWPRLQHPNWLKLTSEEMKYDKDWELANAPLAVLTRGGVINRVIARMILFCLSDRVCLLEMLDHVIFAQLKGVEEDEMATNIKLV